MAYEASQLSFPPGIKTKGTVSTLAGRWVDGDLVRFNGRAVVPVGGWLAASGNPEMTGFATVRNVIAWRGPDNTRYYAMGAADALLLQSGGQYSQTGIENISPADLLEGNESGTISKGYGAGPYGRGAYGSNYDPSDAGQPVPVNHATTWHFGIRQNELFAVSTHDQRLLRWTPPDGAVLAAVVPNAPTGIAAMCVAPNRQILTVGDGANRNMIRWSDSADPELWEPALENNAGFLEFPLIGQAVRVRTYNQDVMLFTTSALYRLQYLGASAGYGVSLIAENCGPVGPNAIGAAGDSVAWMGTNEFFVFTGAGVQSMDCDVHNWVFDDLNRTQAAKINVAEVPNGEHTEIWWFYADKTAAEVNKYAAADLSNGIWLKGTGLTRTAWINSGVYQAPMALSADNTQWVQETGNLAGTGNMESSVLGLIPPIPGRETRVNNLDQDIIGDNNAYPDVTVTLRGANTQAQTFKDLHSKRIEIDGETHLRGAARWLSIRYYFSAWSYWRLGDGTIYTKASGRRARLKPTGQLFNPIIPEPPQAPIIWDRFIGDGIVRARQITDTSAEFRIRSNIPCDLLLSFPEGDFNGKITALEDRIQVVNLTPETVHDGGVLTATSDSGGVSVWSVTPFETDPSTALMVNNISWSEITETTANLSFYCAGIAPYSVTMAGQTSDQPFTGTTIIGTNVVSITGMPSGCWVQNGEASLAITGGSSYGLPELRMLGESPAIYPDTLTWESIRTDWAKLVFYLIGYRQQCDVLIELFQENNASGEPDASVFRRKQNNTTSEQSIIVGGLIAGTNYGGTITTSSRYGVDVRSVPNFTSATE